MPDNKKKLVSVQIRNVDKTRGFSVIISRYSDESIKIEKIYYAR
jgi:hypothetical protein